MQHQPNDVCPKCRNATLDHGICGKCFYDIWNAPQTFENRSVGMADHVTSQEAYMHGDGPFRKKVLPLEQQIRVWTCRSEFKGHPLVS